MILFPVRFSGSSPVGGNDSVAERCRAAAQSGKSDRQKLAEAEREALDIFSRFRHNPEELIDLLRKWDVAIYPGGTTPSVNRYLEKNGLNAGLYSPYSLLRPGVRQNDDKVPREIQPIVQTCEDNRQFAMFLRHGASLISFIHETFHLFQALHGLPLKGSSLKADLRAGEYMQALVAQAQKPGYPQEALKDTLKALAGRDNAAYDALLISLQRENEVSSFLLRYGTKLHLPIDTAYEEQRVSSYRLLLDLAKGL